MKKYDVIVLGNGLATMAVAAYLAKQSRRVALFVVDNGNEKIKRFSYQKKTYRTDVPYYEIGSLGNGELMSFYLSKAGIERKLNVVQNSEATIIKEDGRILLRPNDIKGFKIYLVRHYPKYRNQIHRLYHDLTKHYEDYQRQRINRLRDLPHTLNTLAAQWGNMSLQEVLSSYFKDDHLIREFTSLHPTIGLQPQDIQAYPFFIRMFLLSMETPYFLTETDETIETLFLNDDSLTVYKEPIKEVVFTGNRITSIKTNDDQEFEAQYFCVDPDPDTFIRTYVKEEKGLRLEKLPERFKPVKNPMYRFTTLLILERPFKSFGIKTSQVYFEQGSSSNVQILSMVDYTHMHPKSTPEGEGAILVEYTALKELSEENLLEEVGQKIPKLNQYVRVVKGMGSYHYKGSHDKTARHSHALSALDAFDHYEHLRLYDNTWFTSRYSRPEGGVIGMLQMGIEIGDIINTLLESEEINIPNVSHDTLMSIMATSCDSKGFGSENAIIQCMIGKRLYHMVYNYQGLTVYDGPSPDADMTISATTDVFHQVVLDDLSADDAVKEGKMKIDGNLTLFRKVFDHCYFEKKQLDMTPTKKPFGMVFFFTTIALLTLYGALTMVYDTYVIPLAFSSVVLIKFITQITWLKRMAYYDLLFAGIWLFYGIFKIFSQPLIELQSAYFFLIVSVVSLSCSLLPKTWTYAYLSMDYPPLLRSSRYFKNMLAGLGVIWSLTFGLISMIMFIFSDQYAWLGFHLIFVIGYITYKYPTLYEQSKIKRFN